MVLINQIKLKLLELEGGLFQRLCDDWLYKRGYQNLNAIGMTNTSNKTKTGTPDTLLPQNNGMYIFSEYTTQQGHVRSKIEDDINKCLDPKKTGIPANKITKIIICYLGDLTTTDISELNQKCSEQGIILNIYNIDALAYSIMNDYPILSERYLSLSLDTGQIVDTDVFIDKYNANDFATPINNSILFRDELLQQGEKIITNESKFLLISGSAGVGKTLYAVNLLKLIKNHNPSAKIFCLFNKGIDFSRDITAYFSEPGEYVIFIDDANRLDERLDYILSYLNNIKSNRSFRIIATVRNYAREIVTKKVQQITSHQELTILALTQKQTEELLEKQFKITNCVYQQRIWAVSNGNPRLVVMAARVAKNTGKLSALRNVATLYDDYFGQHENVKNVLNDHNLTKTACIIALLRTVDAKNQFEIENIQQNFGMEFCEFWKYVNILHVNELVDIHENEAVKIADQILSTYLFYRGIFDKKVIPFSSLLINFATKKHHHRIFFKDTLSILNDALIPAINTFDDRNILEQIKPDILAHYHHLRDSNTETEEILKFLKLFLYVIPPSSCFIFIRDLINQKEQQSVDWQNVQFELKNKYNHEDSILALLAQFRYFSEEDFKIALELMLALVAKSSDLAEAITHELTSTLNVKSNDYQSDYIIQRIIIETLLEKSEKGANCLYTKLFICVAETFLETEYEDSYSMQNVFYTRRILLDSSEGILHIRENIFKGLSWLLALPTYQTSVLNILTKYFSKISSYNKELVTSDLLSVTTYFIEIFDKQNLNHCVLVYDYYRQLKEIDVSYPLLWESDFNHPNLSLLSLLLRDREKQKQLDFDMDKYQKYCDEKIRNYLVKLNVNEIAIFFKKCQELHHAFRCNQQSRKSSQIQYSMRTVLSVLAETHLSQYEKIIRYYLPYDDTFAVPADLIINNLLKLNKFDDIKLLIENSYFKNKNLWMTYYFQILPKEKITTDTIKSFINHIKLIDIEHLPNSIDFLIRYEEIEPAIFVMVTKILLERAKVNISFLNPLTHMFSPYSKLFNKWFDLYDDIALVYDAYLGILNCDNYIDYDGKALDLLTQQKPDFLLKFVDKLYEREHPPSSHTEIPRLQFLWLRETYIQDIEKYALHVSEKHKRYFSDTIVHNLFQNDHNKSSNEMDILEKNFFKQTLLNNSNNQDYIYFIFSIIHLKPDNFILDMILFFLKTNNNLSIFKEIILVSDTIISLGNSFILKLEEQKQFLLKLLASLNSSDLLEHRDYVENVIVRINKDILCEKKQEFLNHGLG